MAAGESGAALYRTSLEDLRCGSVIATVESLRREAFALTGSLTAPRDEAELASILPPFRFRLERLLAPALALLDFAPQRGATEVGWMLSMIAAELGDREGQPEAPLLALGLHDLAWALIADCLLRGRLEPLPTLAAAAVASRYYEEVTPIFELSDLRRPTVFERGAEPAYASWRDWLCESELFAALAHLGPRPRLETYLAEAELLSALAFAAAHEDRGFSAAAGDGQAERRLRLDLRDAAKRTSLALFLAVPEPELTETANQLYARLVGPDGFRPRRPLIPTGGAG